MTIIGEILHDGLFAAIAAIGFAAISRPPARTYIFCAIIAAAGHSSRMVLMEPSVAGIHITAATLAASTLIGVLAVLLSPAAHTPAEAYLFPALLPMIPGIYAYRTFGALALYTLHATEASAEHYFFTFVSNGLTCTAILLCMAIGATLPIFALKKVSFQATR
ncbi:MAG: threonine/serine exporter family protein [Muribaculaceae bacterium]|nr:threonine/serine exporter family protein [Muribaculaceae bacterium]